MSEDKNDENILYDSPTEFLHDTADKNECVAQSVIPLEDGTYLCACSCQEWEVVAADRSQGLGLARRHTGSPVG
jgi:hypothetical protein